MARRHPPHVSNLETVNNSCPNLGARRTICLASQPLRRTSSNNCSATLPHNDTMDVMQSCSEWGAVMIEVMQWMRWRNGVMWWCNDSDELLCWSDVLIEVMYWLQWCDVWGGGVLFKLSNAWLVKWCNDWCEILLRWSSDWFVKWYNDWVFFFWFVHSFVTRKFFLNFRIDSGNIMVISPDMIGDIVAFSVIFSNQWDMLGIEWDIDH